jgi:hypothetical protein
MRRRAASAALVLVRLLDRGQGRLRLRRVRSIVKADDRDVLGHAQSGSAKARQRRQGSRLIWSSGPRASPGATSATQRQKRPVNGSRSSTTC